MFCCDLSVDSVVVVVVVVFLLLLLLLEFVLLLLLLLACVLLLPVAVFIYAMITAAFVVLGVVEATDANIMKNRLRVRHSFSVC